METNTPKENHCSRCATAHEEGYENCIDTHQPDSMEWEERFKNIIDGFCFRYAQDLYDGVSSKDFRNREIALVEFVRKEKALSRAEGITFGRVSVLKNFDTVCKADAFIGFTDEEWQAVKKFFELNKEISGWDK